jgi:hypothetical protein
VKHVILFDICKIFVPARFLKIYTHFDAGDFADRAALDGFRCAQELGRAAPLRAHLDYLSGSLGGLPHHFGVGKLDREGLLDVDILACGHGVCENARVGHVGSGNQDGIDVFHRQQVMVAGDLFWGGALLAVDFPDVANGDDGSILAGADKFRQVIARAAPAADLAQADPISGGLLPGRGQGSGCDAGKVKCGAYRSAACGLSLPSEFIARDHS